MRTCGDVVDGQAQQFEDIVRFLSTPSNWAGGAAGVERIETHLSVVFLAGTRALKLKRAVRFPYLDFSTLEKRHAACLEEVATNRRLAPALYRGVIPVVRGCDGGLRLGGEGEVIDWLVDMRSFDSVLDRRAEAGAIGRPTIEALVDRIAGFHAQAERSDRHGGRDGLAWIVDSNRDCFRQWGAGVVEEADVDRAFARVYAELDRLAPLLDGRRATGFVRHVHGDLHLGNVCLFDGAPVPFDAIEFNEVLSRIDVLYDVGFLLMDLAFRGLADLANAAMNRYLDRTGDHGGLPALPLFMAVRAIVRSHVAAAEAARKIGPGRAEAVARARAYLAFAETCLETRKPRVVAIGGLSGTGKSSVARLLAPGLDGPAGARIVRTDTLRKRLLGVSPETRLGAAAYTAEVGVLTYQEMVAEVTGSVAAGRTAIADAVFARPEERRAIEAAARQAGAAFCGLWLEAALAVRLARIAGRHGDASDAGPEVAAAQEGYETGPIEWLRLDYEGSVESVVESIKNHLAAGS